jgi:hypothetical protein
MLKSTQFVPNNSTNCIVMAYLSKHRWCWHKDKHQSPIITQKNLATLPSKLDDEHRTLLNKKPLLCKIHSLNLDLNVLLKIRQEGINSSII